MPFPRDPVESASSRVSGFWSYAHGDDKLDDGAILEMARVIRQEFDLLSGKELTLFVDREDLSWGQEWSATVDRALAKTAFFIPIITPRYFTRDECRRELMEFTAKATELGVQELILPILYVSPSDLSASSSDQAVALIARTQYVDWTQNRLLEPRSREYRTAINALAMRLMEIDANVGEVHLNRELQIGGQDDETAGVADVMKEIEALLPDWLDAVLSDRIVKAQLDATWHEAYSPVVRLQRSHAPASAVFAAQIRAGKEMLAIMERARTDVQTYVSRSVDLDPLVSRVARLVRESPSDFELAAPLREGIDAAMDNIRRGEHSADLSIGRHTVKDHFIELRNRARLFRTLDELSNEIGTLAAEGNFIVTRWDEELRI